MKRGGFVNLEIYRKRIAFSIIALLVCILYSHAYYKIFYYRNISLVADYIFQLTDTLKFFFAIICIVLIIKKCFNISFHKKFNNYWQIIKAVIICSLLLYLIVLAIMVFGTVSSNIFLVIGVNLKYFVILLGLLYAVAC